jgi:hypothetical protein
MLHVAAPVVHVLRRVGRAGDLASLGARSQSQYKEERGELSVRTYRKSPSLVCSSVAGGALGLRGDLDEARAALAEAIKLKPDIDSLTRFAAQSPFTNPEYVALRAKTLYVGRRRAGFPGE